MHFLKWIPKIPTLQKTSQRYSLHRLLSSAQSRESLKTLIGCLISIAPLFNKRITSLLFLRGWSNTEVIIRVGGPQWSSHKNIHIHSFMLLISSCQQSRVTTRRYIKTCLSQSWHDYNKQTMGKSDSIHKLKQQQYWMPGGMQRSDWHLCCTGDVHSHSTKRLHTKVN